MLQTKYVSAEPRNLGVGVDFRPCSEGDFLTERPWIGAIPPCPPRHQQLCRCIVVSGIVYIAADGFTTPE